MLGWIYYKTNNNQINFFLNLFIVLLGLVINLVSIFIFSHKNLNNKTNIGFMHSILCFLNILPLTNLVLLTQILPYFNINLTEYSDFACKFLNFWRRYALDVSSLQQLLITFYLYSSVRHPSTFMVLQSKKLIFYFIIGILVLLALVNAPYLFYELKSVDELKINRKLGHICYSSVEIFLTSTVLNVLFRYI